ncbi:bifunctional phosphoribosyl-AMP cyclohydrolase/phosphoribosyl-ATP diphosphatase HisIE [soil metagenome]
MSELKAAVVQDADTDRVLMLGWMNDDAHRRTTETGWVTFWSRSRQELWEKGATSGNRLSLVSIVADCDGDAYLVSARPTGPICHTGSATCWVDAGGPTFASLATLWEVIADRAEHRPPQSYTTRLLEAGPDATGRKLVEEATEVLLAAKDHSAGAADDTRVAEEAADLLYHLLVVLAERRIDPQTVLDVLSARRR